jgi:tetratricopeptide (TPR) repeat protein
MGMLDPRLRTLLVQADRNATYGKLAAAEVMYREILNERPDAEQAWVGLAEVSSDPSQKRTAYERALELAPDNPIAVAGLARLDGRPVPPEVEAALAAANNQEDETPVYQSAITELDEAREAEEQAYELACYRHPERITSLRCYNCNNPICISCANKTPVGYICPDCQREAEDVFFNSKPLDYLIAVLVSLPISLLAGYLMVNFFSRGFLFFIIIFFVSGAVGSFIGRITKRAIGGRRGRYLPGLVVAMMILGVVIPAIPVILAVLLGNFGAIFTLIGPAIYLFVASGAAYWQMR